MPATWHRQFLSDFLLENPDKKVADNLALFLRISLTGKSSKKALRRIDADNFHAEIAGKGRHHLITFGKAQQPVVNKHTGKLVTDGAMNQRSSNRRIDSSRKTEYHMIRTDLTG